MRHYIALVGARSGVHRLTVPRRRCIRPVDPSASDAVQPPEPIDPNFRIELPAFEGPLDLLLHLIRKHELDIMDLPIAFVTERYLVVPRADEAAEPRRRGRVPRHGGDARTPQEQAVAPITPVGSGRRGDRGGRPAAELIRRLLEYQKYKEAAEHLGGRGITGRDVFLRGSDAPSAEGPAPLAEVGLFKLLDAFQSVLERVRDDLSFEISAERISIQERMTEIVERLRGKQSCSFEDLFEEVATRYDVVVTFLAILEMAKMRMMRIYQPDPRAGIHIEYRVTEAGDGEETADAGEGTAEDREGEEGGS